MGELVSLDEFRLLRGCERDVAYLGVEREIRRLQALQAAMIGEVTESLSYLDDCHRDPASWVMAVTNGSRHAGVAQAHTAAMLAELPAVAAAAARGSVGPEQLRLLTQLHRNRRGREQLPASEALLLGLAISLRLFEFRQVCQRWLAHADPDGVRRDHERARNERSVTVRSSGDHFEMIARGDALTGDIISEILAAHAQAELETDIALRLALHGDAAAQFPLARTARQRRFDALVAMVLKAAGRSETTNRVPLITIHCSESALTAAFRLHVGSPDDGAPDPGDPPRSEGMRLCETQSGAPVDLRDLAVAALIGQVQRVVSDRAGRTIDLGRKSRLFVGAARDAVLLAGDRCCWPGCEVRTGQIQIDHISPWAALLGETSPLNGAPMCPHHNRGKHLGRVRVRRDESGWHLLRPDGTEIAPCH